ncbi:MAG: hypothetical protein ABSH35_08390 [Isosphaeraceae bacterium]
MPMELICTNLLSCFLGHRSQLVLGASERAFPGLIVGDPVENQRGNGVLLGVRELLNFRDGLIQ